ncbi:MAG: hypothetical protein QW782_07225 [Candidatus Bathyarchaeia archaeon]
MKLTQGNQYSFFVLEAFSFLLDDGMVALVSQKTVKPPSILH